METNETLSIRAAEIIVGRELRRPIYDSKGLLLLVEGSVITARFKQLLNDRKIDNLQVHQDDAARITLRDTVVEDNTTVFGFDSELTKKLDALIESGSLFVANTGAAVRDRMVMHGLKGYDPQMRESLLEQHQAAGESLDNMMREAVQGGNFNASQITNVTAVSLAHLTADAEHVLSVAAEVRRDEVLSEHCLQMALLGMAIGIEMGLDEDNVRTIGLCGLVHDWGMIKVPERIRDAKRTLTDAEFLEIKKHSIYVLELLQGMAGIPSVVPLVCYQVHEKPNGAGYPRGRRGNAIHLFARVLQAADAYVGLTSPRPYRKPLMPYAAMECLLRLAGQNDFDPKTVRHLLNVLSLFPVGSFVNLTDASVARVLRPAGSNYTSPIVQIVQDHQGRPVDPSDESAIVDLTDSDLEIVQALPTPGRDEIALNPALIVRARS